MTSYDLVQCAADERANRREFFGRTALGAAAVAATATAWYYLPEVAAALPEGSRPQLATLWVLAAMPYVLLVVIAIALGAAGAALHALDLAERRTDTYRRRTRATLLPKARK